MEINISYYLISYKVTGFTSVAQTNWYMSACINTILIPYHNTTYRQIRYIFPWYIFKLAEILTQTVFISKFFYWLNTWLYRWWEPYILSRVLSTSLKHQPPAFPSFPTTPTSANLWLASISIFLSKSATVVLLPDVVFVVFDAFLYYLHLHFFFILFRIKGICYVWCCILSLFSYFCKFFIRIAFCFFVKPFLISHAVCYFKSAF